MNRDEIEKAVALATDADTTHADAHDWYGAYGWHLTTEDAGDVTLDAVDFDWLDETDDEDLMRDRVVASLRRDHPRLTADEAEAILGKAIEVRDAAEAIEEALDDAAEAYERGDLEACRSALLAAHSRESDHGDAPATRSLAARLLRLEREAYRVYIAPEGSGLSFCGEFETREEAVGCASASPRGLEESLWDAARKAGHCGGLTAPADGGDEDEEPIGWHGEDGCHCVVRVVYSAR